MSISSNSKEIEDRVEVLEQENENDHDHDQVGLELNKVASMAEREEAQARLVGDYKNMKISMTRKKVTDLM